MPIPSADRSSLRAEVLSPLPPGYSGPAPDDKLGPKPDPKPMIRHNPGLGAPMGGQLGSQAGGVPAPSAPPPNPVVRPEDPGVGPRMVAVSDSSDKIRTFEQRLGSGHHREKWSRQPNTNGTGAIHVKSFHCKLTGDSLTFLDQQINEWLDQHPDYEVKLVTTSIGEWTGKLKEPNLIVNVWV
jgi:hypothetical protein